MVWITVEIDTEGYWKKHMSDDYEKTTKEILNRMSVSDLIEQSDASLERADQLFYDSAAAIEITDKGEIGLIRFWKIKSDEREYEVRRFHRFCYCSCRAFFYSHRACKHISVTTGVFCTVCKASAVHKEKLCVGCYGNKYRFGRPEIQEKTI